MFVTNNNQQETARLLRQARSGTLPNRKYLPVDYCEVDGALQRWRRHVEGEGEMGGRVRERRREWGVKVLDQQHKPVWAGAMALLCGAEKSLDQTIYGGGGVMEEVAAMEVVMAGVRDRFRQDSRSSEVNIDIIRQKGRIEANMRDLDDMEEVLEDDLRNLEGFEPVFSCSSSNSSLPSPVSSAVTSRCGETALLLDLGRIKYPDEELERFVLQEFELLENEYQESLNKIKDSLEDVGSVESSEDRTLNFLLSVYYSSGVANKRELFLDLAGRMAPNLSRRELIDKEQKLLTRKNLKLRRKVLLSNWDQARVQYLKQVEDEVNQYRQQLIVEMHRDKEKYLQQNICATLRKQVHAWKEAKIKEHRLKQGEIEMQLKKERELLAIKQEKEQSRRAKENAKVKYVREMQNRDRERWEKRRQESVEEMSKLWKEKSKQNKERVDERKKCEQEKNQRRQQKVEDSIRKKQEVEERLARLRKTVQVHVDVDPQRVAASTEASMARELESQAGPRQRHYVNIQEPLFKVFTYRSEEIEKDGRVRLESALRQAGLLHTDTGRKAIREMVPPTVPRKDLIQNFTERDRPTTGGVK